MNDKITNLKTTYRNTLTNIYYELKDLEKVKNKENKEHQVKRESLKQRDKKLKTAIPFTFGIATISLITAAAINPLLILGVIPAIYNFIILEINIKNIKEERKVHINNLMEIETEETEKKEIETTTLNKLTEITLLELQKRDLIEQSKPKTGKIIKLNFQALQKVNNELEKQIPMESKTVYIKKIKSNNKNS